MFSGQGEVRLRMIELCALPLRGGVAGLAGRGESGVAVIRIRGGVICIAVTGGAILRRAREPVIQVALLASNRNVFAC